MEAIALSLSVLENDDEIAEVSVWSLLFIQTTPR